MVVCDIVRKYRGHFSDFYVLKPTHCSFAAYSKSDNKLLIKSNGMANFGFINVTDAEKIGSVKTFCDILVSKTPANSVINCKLFKSLFMSVFGMFW